MKSVRLRGIFVGSRAMFTDMNGAMATARMKPVIDRVFPFAEFPAALQHMESAAHFGKIVIAV
jgi:NADPH:quinone reductase-like Zn-dependent oxidoreductase